MFAKVNYFGFNNINLEKFLILSLNTIQNQKNVLKMKQMSLQNIKRLYFYKVKWDKALGKQNFMVNFNT